VTERRPLFAAGTVVAVLMLLVGSTPALAGRDRTPPTTPANLRITGLTPYSVSLAWDAATDKSGIASYTICCAYTKGETVNGGATTFTYTKGLEASRQFSLFIVAIDNAGNYSKNSNSVSFTTPPDTTPPTTPTVTVTDVGSTHISLAWSSIDDGPTVWFAVYMDGNAVVYGSRETSDTFGALEPESTHTFTVQAGDFAHQLSPLSDPVTVTTDARDVSDVTPPTMPGNLTTNGMNWGDGETWLFWQKSTDDQTPQSVIEYRVLLNGVYDHSVVGYGQTILYGVPMSWNTYTVIAVDASGNESAPASINVPNF